MVYAYRSRSWRYEEVVLIKPPGIIGKNVNSGGSHTQAQNLLVLTSKRPTCTVPADHPRIRSCLCAFVWRILGSAA